MHQFSVTPGCDCPGSEQRYAFAAYIQVIGCTLYTYNSTASISPTGLLLDHRNEIRGFGEPVSHDSHPWDTFTWQNQSGPSIDRHFIFAFIPSSSYNTSLSESGKVGEAENTLARLIKGDLAPSGFSFPLNLVEFQGSLEQMFASYIWNINRLCQASVTLSPYLDHCGSYLDNLPDGETCLFSSADFKYVLQEPQIALQAVLWNAILSLVCSVLMLVLALAILGTTTNRPRYAPYLRTSSLIDVATLLHESSIPDVLSSKPVKALSLN